MLAEQRALADEACPVCDEMLGELYGASKLGLPVLIETVAPDIRAMLALFCYRRSHLHTIGLVIAASCLEDDLVQSGGIVGAALFARSREAPTPAPIATVYSNRRKITLASGSMRKVEHFDDHLDNDVTAFCQAED